MNPCFSPVLVDVLQCMPYCILHDCKGKETCLAFSDTVYRGWWACQYRYHIMWD